MKMTERDMRTLGAVHRGAGLVKLSNFDKPERRVYKLKAFNLLDDDGNLTEGGKAKLRDYYTAQGWPDLAAKV